MFTIKDYECICPKCGRIWENGFCYECGILLNTKVDDEVIEDPIYYDDDIEDMDIDYDYLFDEEITEGDLDYYYGRYCK